MSTLALRSNETLCSRSETQIHYSVLLIKHKINDGVVRKTKKKNRHLLTQEVIHITLKRYNDTELDNKQRQHKSYSQFWMRLRGPRELLQYTKIDPLNCVRAVSYTHLDVYKRQYLK